MKLKSGFTLREIAGDYLVIPTGSNYLDFGAVITLNETGAFLWNQLTTPTSDEQLCNLLCSEYDVDKVQAAEDISDFICLMKEHGLLDNE